MSEPFVGFVVLFSFLWKEYIRIVDKGTTLAFLTNTYPPRNPLELEE